MMREAGDRHLMPLRNPRAMDIVVEQVFTPEECQEILSTLDDNAWRHAEVGYDDHATVDPDRRSVTEQPLPPGRGSAFPRISEVLRSINAEVHRYELTAVNQIETPNVLRYAASASDHFRPHQDAFPSFSTRKITFSIQLTASDAYVGGDLVFFPDQSTGSRHQGMVTAFPSMLFHSVTPVVLGERFAIVGWLHGPTIR